MNQTDKKVLFLFNGRDRTQLLKDVAGDRVSDNAFRGYNHFPNADYLDIKTATAWLPMFLQRLINPQIFQLLLIPRLVQYDYVIASGQPFLCAAAAWLGAKKQARTRWIFFAVNSSTVLKRHERHPLYRQLLVSLWKRAYRIVCISRTQMRDLENVGISKDKLVFIPYGIDADFYKRHAAPSTEEIIVSVGKDRGRDYRTLFDAVKQLPYPFWIAAMPRNISDTDAVPSHVELHFTVPLLEICAAYARARFVVVVSKNEDADDGSDCSGQTVILEAMAAGKAVIATYRAWMDDYFDKGELITVPANDPHALAEAIETLWSDTEKRMGVARAGHAKAINKYTSTILGANLVRLIYDKFLPA